MVNYYKAYYTSKLMEEKCLSIQTDVEKILDEI